MIGMVQSILKFKYVYQYNNNLFEPPGLGENTTCTYIHYMHTIQCQSSLELYKAGLIIAQFKSPYNITDH